MWAFNMFLVSTKFMFSSIHLIRADEALFVLYIQCFFDCLFTEKSPFPVISIPQVIIGCSMFVYIRHWFQAETCFSFFGLKKFKQQLETTRTKKVLTGAALSWELGSVSWNFRRRSNVWRLLSDWTRISSIHVKISLFSIIKAEGIVKIWVKNPGKAFNPKNPRF